MHDEYPRIVETLVKENPEFESLFQRHQALNKPVDKATGGQTTMSSDSLERMKREKLHIKDCMRAMIDEHCDAVSTAA